MANNWSDKQKSHQAAMDWAEEIAGFFGSSKAKHERVITLVISEFIA